MTLPREVSAYLHASPTDDGEYRLCLFDCDMSSCDYIPLARVFAPVPASVSIDDIKARHVVLLREKLSRVYERANEAAANINEQISRIEALTYTPSKEPAE